MVLISGTNGELRPLPNFPVVRSYFQVTHVNLANPEVPLRPITQKCFSSYFLVVGRTDVADLNYVRNQLAENENIIRINRAVRVLHET